MNKQINQTESQIYSDYLTLTKVCLVVAPEISFHLPTTPYVQCTLCCQPPTDSDVDFPLEKSVLQNPNLSQSVKWIVTCQNKNGGRRRN